MPQIAEARFRARLVDPTPPVKASPAARHRLDAQRAPDLSVRRGEWRHHNVAIPWEPEHRVWTDAGQRDELDAIVALGEGVRVLGTCWGMSELAHPRPYGGVVLARHPRERDARLRAIHDPATHTVRCGLGATFADVFRALRGTGRALANQPGFAGLTVAGAIGTGGHGSGLALGPLLDLVESIELDGPRSGGGRIVVHRDDPRFAMFVLHLGRLGPVTAVTLRTVESFHVAESRAVLPLGAHGRDWRRALRVLVADVLDLQRERPRRIHSVELWIAPYPIDGVLTVALGIRERTRARLSPPDVQRPAALRERSLVAAGDTLAELLAIDELREGVPWVLRSAVQAVETSPPVILPSELGLDFGAPNDAHMGAIEAAVPAERGADAVIAAIEMLVDRAAPPDQHMVFAPMGVRFVGPGPDLSLSPHARRAETVHIEIPTFGDDAIFEGARVLAPVQTMLAERFGGRPHWGQRIYLSPDTLRGLWDADALAAMRRLVEERDPHGDFASPLLDAVLGLPVRSSRARRG